MTYKISRPLALLVGLSLLLAACRPSASPPETPTLDPNAVMTSAAMTAGARMTENAALTPSPVPATATNTPQPPTVTVAATTAAPAAAATTPPASTGSDKAQWVADVTIPDGTNMTPGQTFTKTWRLQNVGTSTWTTAYSMVFVTGAPMTTTTKAPLTQQVGPGQSIDVSVNMTAPSDPGNYKGFWKVANAQGAAFDVAVWVDINVAGTPGAPTSTAGTPAAGTATSGTATVTATAGATTSGENIVTGVTLSVNTASYTGDCPYTFILPAQLTLSKPATVTYQLEAGSTASGFTFNLPAATTVSLQAGTHDITYQLEFSQSLNGWVRFHVTAPNDAASPQVAISLTCN